MLYRKVLKRISAQSFIQISTGIDFLFSECTLWDWCTLFVTLCIQGGPKMAPIVLHLITSPNINRFLKFFHCGNQKAICNKTVTIDPTTPQVCRYTTSWDVIWRTQAGDATDQLRDQRWSSLACGPKQPRLKSGLLRGPLWGQKKQWIDDIVQWGNRSLVEMVRQAENRKSYRCLVHEAAYARTSGTASCWLCGLGYSSTDGLSVLMIHVS